MLNKCYAASITMQAHARKVSIFGDFRLDKICPNAQLRHTAAVLVSLVSRGRMQAAVVYN